MNIKSAEPVLRMTGICKSFGGVRALDNVDLTLYKGEVLGLIGENGAGKSTLMKIIAGIVPKDSGDVYIGDHQMDITDVRQTKKLGVGVIYQELSIFSDLTVAQNIFINQEIKIGGFILNQKEMNMIAAKVLREELGIILNPKSVAKDLSLGQKQSLEIARSLVQKKNIIMMDEPTAAMEETEREYFFNVIKRLKKSGTSVIFISHHLEEVMSICDRVIVLRDGKKTGDVRVDQIDINNMIQLMIGKSLKQQYPKEYVPIGEIVLQVKDLNKANIFQNISFDLKKSEILGFCGLEGCGKNEIMRCLFGIMAFDSGEISIQGEKFKKGGIVKAMQNKIAFLPAERKTEGLFMGRDVEWNLSIAILKKLGRIMINKKKENMTCDKYIESLFIKVSKRSQALTSLSGGNQQKVMIGRWLMTEPEIILMEEPTRGIDVGAKREVYKLVSDCVKDGKSVCIISSEGIELLGMCDRIIVINEGKITNILDPKTTTEQELTYYITRHEGDLKNE